MPEEKRATEAVADDFTLEIMPERFTWKDQRMLARWKDMTSEEQQDATYELFERLVVGGAEAVPVIYTAQAVQAIMAAIAERTQQVKNVQTGSSSGRL